MTTVLTRTIARTLFLPGLVVAVGILVKGYTSTGDGFAAGVIAALAVLIQVVTFGQEEVERWLPLQAAPALAFAGLGIGLAVAFGPALLGRPIMTHAPTPGAPVVHLGTLEILTAVLFDVGVFLLVLGFAVSAITMVARAQERSER
jgi:multisubunit Na+/H+ antiporter MnhB subunit